MLDWTNSTITAPYVVPDTENETITEVNLDLPLICDIEWRQNDGTTIPCGNLAVWVASCHDEVEEHNYEQTLFCDECFILGKYKNKCLDCGAKLIVNPRKL